VEPCCGPTGRGDHPTPIRTSPMFLPIAPNISASLRPRNSISVSDTFADPERVVHLESVGTLADVGAGTVDAVHQCSGALVAALLALVHV